MLEEMAAIYKTFVGLIGAFISAMVGIATKLVYSEENNKIRKLLIGVPLAIFCSILAGGIGQFFEAPDLIRFAIAGSLAYMGPDFIAEQIRRRTMAITEPDKTDGAPDGNGVDR